MVYKVSKRFPPSSFIVVKYIIQHKKYYCLQMQHYTVNNSRLRQQPVMTTLIPTFDQQVPLSTEMYEDEDDTNNTRDDLTMIVSYLVEFFQKFIAPNWQDMMGLKSFIQRHWITMVCWSTSCGLGFVTFRRLLSLMDKLYKRRLSKSLSNNDIATIELLIGCMVLPYVAALMAYYPARFSYYFLNHMLVSS